MAPRVEPEGGAGPVDGDLEQNSGLDDHVTSHRSIEAPAILSSL